MSLDNRSLDGEGPFTFSNCFYPAAAGKRGHHPVSPYIRGPSDYYMKSSNSYFTNGSMLHKIISTVSVDSVSNLYVCL